MQARKNADILIVIPARYGSTRFPGKPLVLIAGISLIERVYRLCSKAGAHSTVIVATDDRRIERHVLRFGGRVMMTRKAHPSGTDRVAEVARRFPCDIVINVQGDEPMLDPSVIRKLADVMRREPSLPMATLCHPIKNEKDYRDPNVVKVVCDREGYALYFSRSPIPHFRKLLTLNVELRICFRHIGIYAYRVALLQQFVTWPVSALERTEKLEQLRAMENGAEIRIAQACVAIPGGVDTAADLERVRHWIAQHRL